MKRTDPIKNWATQIPFGVRTLSVHVMPEAHQHSDMELNYVFSGRMTYLLGGQLVTLSPGALTAFWATVPHQVIHIEPNTRLGCAVLPMNWVLQWPLPKSFVKNLLNGHMLTDPSQPQLDGALIQQWAQDCQQSKVIFQKIALDEIQARLKRFGLNHQKVKTGKIDPIACHPKIIRLTRYIAEHFTEDLPIDQIAKSVGLHPNYAMTLFRKHYGLTLNQYVTRQRISYAQRLLITHDMDILQVALASGFNSLSRFYKAFKEIAGQTPRAYRLSLRQDIAEIKS